MKDDVNDEMPNETFKTLIPLDGVLKQDGATKSSCKLKGLRGTVLHIYEVGYKDLWHEVWFENGHLQMIN